MRDAAGNEVTGGTEGIGGDRDAGPRGRRVMSDGQQNGASRCAALLPGWPESDDSEPSRPALGAAYTDGLTERAGAGAILSDVDLVGLLARGHGLGAERLAAFIEHSAIGYGAPRDDMALLVIELTSDLARAARGPVWPPRGAPCGHPMTVRARWRTGTSGGRRRPGMRARRYPRSALGQPRQGARRRRTASPGSTGST